MNHALRLHAIAVASFSVLAGAKLQTAYAQEQLSEISVKAQRHHGDGYAPENTTTGLKINVPLKDVPQTINVISQEVMRDQGARSLQDVLKNVPGVGLATGDGQRDAFVIRGFSALYDIYL